MKFIFLFTFLFFYVFVCAQSANVEAAKALAKRIIPSYANNIGFEDTIADKDVFEIDKKNNTIL